MDKSVFQLNPQSDKCDCIICHKKNVISSNEHIIPKALGGYMHTWNVCKSCNSILGNEVDTKLVNHYMIKFERYTHQLKGESRTEVPNPLEGTFTAEDGEKYKLIDEKGILTPHIINHQIRMSDDGNQLLLTIDLKDKNKVNSIIDSYCKRKKLQYDLNGIEMSAVKTKESPYFKFSFKIDIADFRIGILKIAYEYVSTLIPSYIEDECALKISSILEKADLSRLNEIEFRGSGFEDIFPNLFGNFIDFSNRKRHYILLTNYNGKMFCFVKLFNTFCLGIKMSDKSYFEVEKNIIAINDFQKQEIDLFDLDELVDKSNLFESIAYRFMEPYEDEIKRMSKSSSVGIYCDCNNHNYCFDKNGKCIGIDLDCIVNYPDEFVETKIENDKAKTIYNIGGQFFFRLYPENKLAPVKEIIMISTIKKI